MNSENVGGDQVFHSISTWSGLLMDLPIRQLSNVDVRDKGQYYS